MAVTLNGTATASNVNAAAALAVPMPTGMTNGELAFVEIATAGAAVITAPGAVGYWVQLFQSLDGFGEQELAVFVRTVDGTEGATQTFTFSTAQGAAVAFRLGGQAAVNAINVISAAGTNTSGSTTAMTAPSANSTVDGGMVLRFGSTVQSVGVTNPGSHTAIGTATNGTNSTDPTISCCYRTQTSAGATGTADFVSSAGSGNRSWVAYTVVIAPAAPTINTQPASIAQYAGLTATFNISATASAGALHYQWKVNGSNVGTDSASYTTGTLTPSNNQDSVTCVVTDSNGSNTSTAAILTVLPTSSSAWIKA